MLTTNDHAKPLVEAFFSGLYSIIMLSVRLALGKKHKVNIVCTLWAFTLVLVWSGRNHKPP